MIQGRRTSISLAGRRISRNRHETMQRRQAYCSNLAIAPSSWIGHGLNTYHEAWKLYKMTPYHGTRQKPRHLSHRQGLYKHESLGMKPIYNQKPQHSHLHHGLDQQARCSFHTTSSWNNTSDATPEHQPPCWHCGRQVTDDNGTMHWSPQCPSCHALQPPPRTTSRTTLAHVYFRVMGLPTPTFDVSLVQLKERYLYLQRLCHPDRVVHATEEEKAVATSVSAVVNEAHQRLMDPLSRATLLGRRTSMETDDELTGTKGRVDQALLMDMLELHEELDELLEMTDQGDHALAAFLARIEEVYETPLVLAMARQAAEGNWEGLEASIVAMRYYRSLKSKANP